MEKPSTTYFIEELSPEASAHLIHKKKKMKIQFTKQNPLFSSTETIEHNTHKKPVWCITHNQSSQLHVRPQPVPVSMPPPPLGIATSTRWNRYFLLLLIIIFKLQKVSVSPILAL